MDVYSFDDGGEYPPLLKTAIAIPFFLPFQAIVCIPISTELTNAFQKSSQMPIFLTSKLPKMALECSLIKFYVDLVQSSHQYQV